MRFKLILLAVLIVLAMNMISAEIMLSQPQAIYNLGDSLGVSATIKASQDSSGFFELSLNCENGSQNFYRSPLSLKADEERKIETSLVLTKSVVLGAGNCDLDASFIDESKQSQQFKVSDKVDVSLNVDNLSVDPSKEVIVKGNAKKENNQQVEGFLELKIENTDIGITQAVVNGSFIANFSFPENAKSGNYILIARVYEKYQGEETNNGEAKTSVFVKKKPTKIEIAVSNQNIKPGEKLIIKPTIYDQANEDMEGDVGLKFYDSKDKIFFQKVLKSGEEKEIHFETNSTPGYWRVEANALGLNAKRLFYVEELEKANFIIVNDTLTIINIGNVPYKNTVQISINNITDTQNVELAVGESISFKLEAPEGRYKILVTDGSDSLDIADVGLTGNVIGVNEIKQGASIFTRYPLVWIFLIAVFGMFILIMVRKSDKKKFYAFPIEKIKERISKKKEIKSLEVGNKMPIETAEHTVVLDGRKETGSLIAIKIKDLNDIKKSCKYTIESIIKTIVENKGSIYETSDYIIGVFSSPTTKTFENDLQAVKISRKIEEILKEHNKKMRQKISYGISLNSGELILKKEADKLKFTGIGNTLSLAKRIAEIAKEEVLLSDSMQKKVMNEVKTEREIRFGLNVYHIKEIVDRGKHSGFIQGFLKRQEK